MDKERIEYAKRRKWIKIDINNLPDDYFDIGAYVIRPIGQSTNNVDYNMDEYVDCILDGGCIEPEYEISRPISHSEIMKRWWFFPDSQKWGKVMGYCVYQYEYIFHNDVHNGSVHQDYFTELDSSLSVPLPEKKYHERSGFAYDEATTNEIKLKLKARSY